jgi:transposase
MRLDELLEEKHALEQALDQKQRALEAKDRALEEQRSALRAHQGALTERDALLARHMERIFELEHQIETLLAQLQSSTRDQRALEARLKELLAKRRALADSLAPGQLALLFGEEPLPTPPCVNEAPDGETGVDKIRPRHRRAREPRKLSYEALPREHVRYELAPEERVCPVTGKSLVQIDEKTSEVLEYRPGALVVIVHHRAVYGLSAEDQEERTIEPLVTPARASVLEGVQAGPALLARILVQKYCNHLPLYRQQAIFEREGLLLPRQTMCDWVMASAFQLGPIQQALRRQILASGLVQLDDTPVQCQGGPGEKNFQAHLWSYVSPRVEGVVFDFARDRTHEHVLDFLGDAAVGWLVGDGYAGYETIAKKRPGVIVAGCWVHTLRKFRDALKDWPSEASSMLALIGRLFDVEAEADEKELAATARHDLRAERCPSILERIRAQAESLRGKGSDQETIEKARKYLENQWACLVVFLQHGDIPIHNNACERSIRQIAIGRRNWLFAGSERGGEAAAVVYSLIESCRLAKLDPAVYVSDVLVRVATHPANRVDELVPARWKELFATSSVR